MSLAESRLRPDVNGPASVKPWQQLENMVKCSSAVPRIETTILTRQ